MSRWIRNDRWERYAPEEPRARHVWVRAPAGPEQAGLVMSWRSEVDGSWLAQVALTVDDQLRMEWVPSDRLRPAAAAQPPRFDR